MQQGAALARQLSLITSLLRSAGQPHAHTTAPLLVCLWRRTCKVRDSLMCCTVALKARAPQLLLCSGILSHLLLLRKRFHCRD